MTPTIITRIKHVVECRPPLGALQTTNNNSHNNNNNNDTNNNNTDQTCRRVPTPLGAPPLSPTLGLTTYGQAGQII